MKKRLLPAIALILLCLTAAPPPVRAFDLFQSNAPGGGVCNNSDNSNSTVCQSQPATDAHGKPIDPLTGPNGILAEITNIVAFVAGVAAIIMIIVSALKFITSGSNVSTGSRTDTDVEDARRGLANAVIGLVVIVLARTLIVYLINKL